MLNAHPPPGFSEHKKPLPGAEETLAEISRKMPPTPRLAAEAKAPKAAKQLGTLGGGNHFLELLYDEGGCVWIMLHSGSRGIGAPRTPPLARRQRGLCSTVGMPGSCCAAATTARAGAAVGYGQHCMDHPALGAPPGYSAHLPV